MAKLVNMNYQIILDETLKKISLSGKTPKLLLHACCGPCSTSVIEFLSNYFDLDIYFYKVKNKIII